MLGLIRSPLRLLRDQLRNAGIEIQRRTVQNTQGVQLVRLLQHLEVDLVLDVGANQGQYGCELRQCGYLGRIVSFEPLASARSVLERCARRSQAWVVAPRMALGATEAEIDLNVAGNSVSSSLLNMLPTHMQAAPDSAYVGQERVIVRRLDRVAGEYLASARRVLLKIDTQGYEEQVLDGATGVLNRVCALQVELTLVPLYAGQGLFDDIRTRIEAHGFALFALFPGYVDERSGRTLQVDGVFVRRELEASAAP